MEQPHVFVRPTTPLDAGIIGEIHASNMRTMLENATGAPLDDDAAAAISPTTFAESWRQSIVTPPVPGATILSAISDGVVVGFAALLPVYHEEDANKESVVDSEPAGPAVEITAFEVSAAHTHHGHGSRLLAAVSDTAQDMGASELATWVVAGDDARTAFFSSAGFAPAGVRRTLQVGEHSVIEHRWHALLA